MKTSVPIDYVAMLGHRAKNRTLQKKISRYISLEIMKQGYGICYGNIEGSFGCMSKKTKSQDGIVRLITTDKVPLNNSLFCDVLEIVNTQNKKHCLLSNTSIGAVILSDDVDLQNIITQFISNNKPVIAIEQLVNKNKLPSETIVTKNYKAAISKMIFEINMINFSNLEFSCRA